MIFHLLRSLFAEICDIAPSYLHYRLSVCVSSYMVRIFSTHRLQKNAAVRGRRVTLRSSCPSPSDSYSQPSSSDWPSRSSSSFSNESSLSEPEFWSGTSSSVSRLKINLFMSRPRSSRATILFLSAIPDVASFEGQFASSGNRYWSSSASISLLKSYLGAPIDGFQNRCRDVICVWHAAEKVSFVEHLLFSFTSHSNRTGEYKDEHRS